jgi:peptidoglycan/xylan/chitin deacetylase (PgdA/CDA1 family)
MFSKRINYKKTGIVAILIIVAASYGFAFLNYFNTEANNVKYYVNSGYASDNVRPIAKEADEAYINLASSKVNSNINQSVQAPINYNIPVLIYHKTPDNFEEQLQALREKGYSTITMNELNSIVRGYSKAPPKPAAITFDDGFSDQSRAFELLKKYNMKATFYIIVGGDNSDWCIGAERRNLTCGDAYMNWGEIKKLSDSGLIEIGAHTINHLSLPDIPITAARVEIFNSKSIIQQKIGKDVNSFAYPYGKMNQQLADLVAQAGYTNATGTKEGSIINLANIYDIPRLRSTLKLP